MLSVVEQRAGRWGSLVAGMPAAGTQQVSAGEDQYGAHVEGNAPGDQQSAVDNTSYDLPSVNTVCPQKTKPTPTTF